jgi:hypothetical protein
MVLAELLQHTVLTFCRPPCKEDFRPGKKQPASVSPADPCARFFNAVSQVLKKSLDTGRFLFVYAEYLVEIQVNGGYGSWSAAVFLWLSRYCRTWFGG